MGNQRSSISADIHGGRYGAIAKGATSVQVQQPSATQNLIQQQVLGTNISTFEIDFPALANFGAHADANFSQPLGLPPVNLNRFATGLVEVVLSLTESATGLLVTFTQQFSYGGVAPSNVWTIPTGGTFAGGKVVGVARALALATASAQTLTVLCSAKVIGIPPPGSS